MKRFFVLTFMFVSVPAFGFTLNPRGYFSAGEFVNVEIVEPKSESVTNDVVGYIFYLNSALKNEWNPPLHLKSSKTVYTFETNAEKQLITHIKLLRTSGFDDVDRSALALLKPDLVFTNYPQNSSFNNLQLQVTFVRHVFGKADVQNNGIRVVLTDNSKKSQISGTDGFVQKIYCRNYIRQATNYLKKNFVMSDYPVMYTSVFMIDILRDGSVSNVVVTATSGDRKYNNEVITRLLNTKFKPFPYKFLANKVTLEYKVSNHIKKQSKK